MQEPIPVRSAHKKSIFAVSLLLCLISSNLLGQEIVPLNHFHIGDSIGEGEAANGIAGTRHHENVWATGYAGDDQFSSFSERFTASCPTVFEGNNPDKDPLFNQAESGANMIDFSSQATAVVQAATSTEAGTAGMISIYLGNNDACADTLSDMTPAGEFEDQFRAGLDILASSPATKNARIHVSAIPSLYWLWVALKDDKLCKLVWQLVPCQNLLENAVDDCGTADSAYDPDVIHDDDGANCIRRKQFHAVIRDVYNPILKNVLQEYIADKRLPNGYFSDVSMFQFQAEHINKGDCFHPSLAGQALLAEKEWQQSPWADGTQCHKSLPAKNHTFPWLLLLRE
jgi:lysophospholipase L1-like esterase